MIKKTEKELVIYQEKNGAIELYSDFSDENIFANQKQIADIFGIERSVVTKHIKKLLDNGEIEEKSNVQKMHIANSDKPVKFYSLDVILAVGYKTNSSKAIIFRKWATKVLKNHIIKGFTINKKRILQNHKEFLKAVNDIKLLAKNNDKISQDEILELIKTFSYTWFSLESYDKQNLPKKGKIKRNKKIDLDKLSKNLYQKIDILKKELINKKEATELFAQEKNKNSLDGILRNIFQSAFEKEIYGTVEEKAAHLLYFIIKNHPFTDGNKRTGAFSFIWFLQKQSLIQKI